MGFFTWIKGLLPPQGDTIRVNCQTIPLAKWEAINRHLDREIARRRGSNAPLSFDEWLAPPPPKMAAAINRHLDREIARRRGSNPPAPGNKPAAPSGPPTKPQPPGGRLIYTDRDPGPANRPVPPVPPVPPVLPDDLADLPELTAQHLDGAAAAPAPAEMPSDKLMERWKRAAIAEHAKGGEPTWRTAALLAFAEGQRQAQSHQLPPPGADPVATDEELAYVWIPPCTYEDARRAIYDRGRADERCAILRALGVSP